MGKITFDPLQKAVVDAFKTSSLIDQFYFTGGTALSIFYFQHRLSEDLDFFTEKKFSSNLVIPFMNEVAQKTQSKITMRQPEEFDIVIFSLDDGKWPPLKIDFNYYPYPRVEKSKDVDGLPVDSLRDIGGNKLLCINQRTDVKDFVDLYFILKKYSLWDLRYVVEAKFKMDLELVMNASDFLKVETFEYLPKMLIPLTLPELKTFFKEQAVIIGKRITK